MFRARTRDARVRAPICAAMATSAPPPPAYRTVPGAGCASAGVVSDGAMGGAALLAYGMLLATCLSWAGNSIAGRMAAGEVSPLLLVSLRWALAIVIVYPFARPHLVREREAVRRHWRHLALLGMVGFTLFNAVLYISLTLTTAVNVVLLQAALPALIFLLNFALYRTRVVALQIVGFLVSLAGVSLVVFGSGAGLAAVNRGDLLILLGVAIYAGYTIALSRKPRVHWLTAITVMGTAAFVASLPVAAWEIARGAAIWPDEAGDWVLVLFTAIFPSLVAQICFMRAVDLIGANRAGIFTNMTPVLGTLMAVAILGEAFGWHHAAALALAMGGIALAEWGARRARAPAA